jgi:hypothetical protein
MTPDYLDLFLTADLIEDPGKTCLGYGKGESQKKKRFREPNVGRNLVKLRLARSLTHSTTATRASDAGLFVLSLLSPVDVALSIVCAVIGYVLRIQNTLFGNTYSNLLLPHISPSFNIRLPGIHSDHAACCLHPYIQLFQTLSSCAGKDSAQRWNLHIALGVEDLPYPRPE